jgi:hypothetical protein
LTPKGIGSGVNVPFPSNGTHAANKDYVDSLAPPTPGAAGTVQRSDGADWVASTFTITDTFAANTLVYASSANTVAGLTTTPASTLASNGSGVPTWVEQEDGELLIGSTGAIPVSATLTGGTGITISSGAGSITIDATGGGVSWNEVTGTSQSMAINNGYIANNGAQVDLTLPATASVGDAVVVQGKGAGGWKISQNAGQTIHFGASDTTTGTGGSLESTNRYDSVELLCITDSTDWAVLTGPQGTLTVT